MTYQEIIQKPGKKIKPIVYYYDSNNQRIDNERDNFKMAKLFFNAKLLGTVMKGLELELKNKLPDTAIYLEVTATYGNNSAVETYGPYYFKEIPTYNADTKTYTHNLYDQLIKTMVDYSPISISYPCTLYSYFQKLVETLGLNTNVLLLPNGSRILNSDIYSEIGYTYRDVLEDIGQATASLFEVNGTTLKRVAISSSNKATINDDILKNKNISFSQMFGPINTIVLSRSANADSIYLSDESMISNGRKEIIISDNQLMNDNNRDDYLEELLSSLKGITYAIFDTELVGYGGFEPLQNVEFNSNGEIYESYVFNNEIEITQGYQEVIYTDFPNLSTPDYKTADKTDKRVSKVFMIVDKQQKEINATVEKVDAHGTAITNLQIRDGEIQTNIDDANGNIAQLKATVEGLENNVTTVGGGNLIKDSLGSLNDGSWSDNVTTIRDTYTLGNSIAGQGIMLNANTIEQKIQLPNEVHTLSFKYKKLLSTINAKLYVNDVVFNLDQIDTTEFTHQINVVNNSVTIKFECDTNNGCYILDLMLNLGSTKDVWTQNANETSTDTVKIGKGIQVEDSKYGTYWRADADGTRVINKVTGDIVQQATDRGTETNEFISRGTSIVNGVLHQRVGEQVWESVV